MIKCFFIALFLISALTVFLFSCSDKKVVHKTKEALRFEKLLQEAKLESSDSVRYVIWNSSSCGGCRVTSIKLLQDDTVHHLKLIVPFRFGAQTGVLNASMLFVDTNGIFDKVYFGVDNIGIINVYNGNVVSIKNYNPEAMDSLEADLVK